MDAVSIYIIPLGALIAAVMFFWICPKGYAREQIQMGREKRLENGWSRLRSMYLSALHLRSMFWEFFLAESVNSIRKSV